MARQRMTGDQMMQWIVRKLGFGRVKIELLLCHLKDVIEDTKDWYLANKGHEKRVLVPVSAGEVAYPYPEDAETILDVIPPADPHDFGTVFSPYLFTGDSFPFDVYTAPYSAGGPVSGIAQAIQYNEMAERVIGADFNWTPDDSSRVLVISPEPRREGESMMLIYSSNEFSMTALSAQDYHLFKEYAKAEAKETLGYIRRKYGNIPGVDGSQTLDGDRMMDEAREDKEKLDEKMNNSGLPMPFITG